MNKNLLIMMLVLFTSIAFVSCKEAVLEKAVYQGEHDMAWAIAHYIEYPVDEMEFNRTGFVKVSFLVNEQGSVSEVKAVIDDGIKAAEIAVARKKLADKQVLPINFSVVQSLIKSVERLNFQPAKKNGKPISSTVTTSVEFMLI